MKKNGEAGIIPEDNVAGRGRKCERGTQNEMKLVVKENKRK